MQEPSLKELTPQYMSAALLCTHNHNMKLFSYIVYLYYVYVAGLGYAKICQ